MHFVDVEASVTDQFPVQQEHGNLVAEALASGAIAVHVGNVDTVPDERGQDLQFGEHLLAESATAARIEQKRVTTRALGSQCASAPPSVIARTDRAICWTVCAGTSPTAVT